MKRIIVNDKIQKGYEYFLSEEIGKNFHLDFTPELTPKQMLKLGVFGGKYMNDCKQEFPDDWYVDAKLSEKKKDINLNYYKVDASLPLIEWVNKGWIYKEDPRGWFQWYCRYTLGRRIQGIDIIQIKRWKNFRRHVTAVEKNCEKGNLDCRKKQRQAILQWAYDPYR